MANITGHNPFQHFFRGPGTRGKSGALRSALALFLTLAIGYGVLALLVLAWPGLGAGFMKALFHGLDLFHMQGGPDFLTLPYLLYVLLGTVACVVGLALLYSWIRDKLLR